MARRGLETLARRAAGGDIAAAERLVAELRARGGRGDQALARAREGAAMLREAVVEAASAAAGEFEERRAAKQTPSEARDWACENSPILDDAKVVLAAATLIGIRVERAKSLDEMADKAFWSVVVREMARRRGQEAWSPGDPVWVDRYDRGMTAAFVEWMNDDGTVVIGFEEHGEPMLEQHASSRLRRRVVE